jgi:hypothetical protein
MATIPTLRWAGPSDATEGDQYQIYCDQAVAGQFLLLTTVTATAPYASPTTALAQALSQDGTTVVLSNGTSFAQGDYVMIDDEMIRLGAKSSNTFSSCERGVGFGIVQAHSQGATVYKLHESYTHSGVQWQTDRLLIRYRVVRVKSNGDRSVAAEALVFNPPMPPNTRYITVYLAVVNSAGSPVPNIAISCQIDDTDNYTTAGELIFRTPLTTTTGPDGAAYFFLSKDAIRRGGDAFTIFIARGTEGEVRRQVNDVPDLENAVNFLVVAQVPSP